jgi:hypothetical protein
MLPCASDREIEGVLVSTSLERGEDNVSSASMSGEGVLLIFGPLSVIAAPAEPLQTSLVGLASRNTVRSPGKRPLGQPLISTPMLSLGTRSLQRGS